MNSCTFEFKTHLEFSPEEIRTLPIDDIIGSVAETRDRFAKEYFDSVMNFIQSSLFDRWFGKKYDRTFVYRSDDVPFSCPKCNGKKEGFIRKGKRKRKLKTSLGEMTFSFFRLECRSCKAKFSPFPLFFGIGERVRLSEELLRKLLVMATEVPYKKASDFSRLFTDVPIGAKTVWNKAQEFGEKAEDSLPKTAESDVGMGDSTKVKAGNRDTHKRGLDAHVVIACEKEEKRHGRNSIAKTLLAFSVSLRKQGGREAAETDEGETETDDRRRGTGYEEALCPDMEGHRSPTVYLASLLPDGVLPLEGRREEGRPGRLDTKAERHRLRPERNSGADIEETIPSTLQDTRREEDEKRRQLPHVCPS
jgi:hypothetical protein